MPKLTLSFKGNLLRHIPVGEGESVIGSQADCPVYIDSLAIQPRHASITINGERAILRDLGTPDGTFVNEARLSGDYTLKNGDEIRVGKHTLSFSFESVPSTLSEPVPEPSPMLAARTETAAADIPDTGDLALEPLKPPRHAFLQILNGQNLGKTISLNRHLTNLGKPGVQTAIIAHRDDGYFLSHLEGDTPPRVGDVSIGDRAWQLSDGDIVQIGNVRMQFYMQ